MNIEIRAAQLAEVSYPRRLIDLIVMPYETETQVAVKGKLVGEIVSRGAFDGLERRANRIKVNRDHNTERTFGRAVAFYTSRQEGLVAQIKVANTPLGEESLVLADEGILDASAGFTLRDPGWEVWETRTRRRLNKVWLEHIAMTPDPAYETANVLAVRHTPEATIELSPTPNRDRWLIAQQQAEYERLNVRWGVVTSG